MPIPPAIRIWRSPASLSGKLFMGADDSSTSPSRNWSCTKVEPPRLSVSGSMAKAARHLSTSQPVLSKTIAELEHALGVRLLDRGPQGVAPTIYGQALINRGRAIFDELREGIKEIEFLADPAAGELRIGCP